DVYVDHADEGGEYSDRRTLHPQDPLGHLTGELLEQGGEELLLVGVVLVVGGAGDVGPLGDVLDGDRVVPAVEDQRHERLADGGPRLPDATVDRSVIRRPAPRRTLHTGNL